MGFRAEIETRGGVPIYVQLVEQVSRAVEVGGLRAGERLPTVRALARELTIAPNTIVKAYNELQRMGVIESRPGVGTVVSRGVGAAMEGRRLEAFDARVRELVRDAASLDISQDDLWEKVDAEFERLAAKGTHS